MFSTPSVHLLAMLLATRLPRFPMLGINLFGFGGHCVSTATIQLRVFHFSSLVGYCQPILGPWHIAYVETRWRPSWPTIAWRILWFFFGNVGVCQEPCLGPWWHCWPWHCFSSGSKTSSTTREGGWAFRTWGRGRGWVTISSRPQINNLYFTKISIQL